MFGAVLPSARDIADKLSDESVFRGAPTAGLQSLERNCRVAGLSAVPRTVGPVFADRKSLLAFVSSFLYVTDRGAGGFRDRYRSEPKSPKLAPAVRDRLPSERGQNAARAVPLVPGRAVVVDPLGVDAEGSGRPGSDRNLRSDRRLHVRQMRPSRIAALRPDRAARHHIVVRDPPEKRICLSHDRLAVPVGQTRANHALRVAHHRFKPPADVRLDARGRRYRAGGMLELDGRGRGFVAVRTQKRRSCAPVVLAVRFVDAQSTQHRAADHARRTPRRHILVD